MKKALARLQGGIRPLIIEWRIDAKNDLVYVTKNRTTVDMRTPDAVVQAANEKRRVARKGCGKGGGIFGAGGPKLGADGALLPAM